MIACPHRKAQDCATLNLGGIVIIKAINDLL